jgi:peptide/nickel transport system permease protein
MNATGVSQVAGSVPTAGVRSRGPWSRALRRLRRRPLGLAALFVLLCFAVAALIAPSVSPYSAARVWVQFVNRPQPASLHGGHLLGTTMLGQDMLSQLLSAVRATVFSSVLIAMGATAIGVVVGLLAGFYGGGLDAGLGWVTGVVVTMPAVAIVLLLVVYDRPVSRKLLVLVLICYLWTGVSRAVRAKVASLRVREFVEAGYAAGASDLRVMVRHLLPNSVGVLLVAGTAVVGQSILIIATIDFFQLGAEQPDSPSLGGLVANAVRGLGLGVPTPWGLYLIPTVVLALLLVSINVAADTLDDVLNPVGRG